MAGFDPDSESRHSLVDCQTRSLGLGREFAGPGGGPGRGLSQSRGPGSGRRQGRLEGAQGGYLPAIRVVARTDNLAALAGGGLGSRTGRPIGRPAKQRANNLTVTQLLPASVSGPVSSPDRSLTGTFGKVHRERYEWQLFSD